MTENADVEWLRTQANEPQWLTNVRARRLLAHIDELEADNNRMRGWIDHLESKVEGEIDINVRPTIHEIAPQIMAALRLASYLSHKQAPTDSETIASWAYADAEALEAEGRRRDG